MRLANGALAEDLVADRHVPPTVRPIFPSPLEIHVLFNIQSLYPLEDSEVPLPHYSRSRGSKLIFGAEVQIRTLSLRRGAAGGTGIISGKRGTGGAAMNPSEAVVHGRAGRTTHQSRSLS